MGNGLSPLVSLATAVHSQPGVYAVLLGSGVSTGAGLLTGWGVVSELVARVAAVSGVDDAGIAAARADPEGWWKEHGEGELGYSTLLEELAPSAAGRQGLLAEFFVSATGDDEPTVRQPSRAHHAIAQLVRRGAVRVIVTTNFDRLMEQALEAVGVSPQVISRPEAVNGMAPLAHSPATIIKLHGDYRDLGSRNTPSELAEYPEEWKRLLAQVFDDACRFRRTPPVDIHSRRRPTTGPATGGCARCGPAQLSRAGWFARRTQRAGACCSAVWPR